METILKTELNVISPMFSYGNQELEARPFELKGLMRYIYRISNLEEDTAKLYNKESALFGGTIKDNNIETLVASPLRLELFKNKGVNHSESEIVIRSYKKGYQPKKTKCFRGDGIFNLTLRLRKNDEESYNYVDLLKLALILGGIGKRARRARGCMTYDELSGMTREDQIKFVLDQLNLMNKGICEEAAFVRTSDNIIKKLNFKNIFERPVIEKIEFGKNICSNKVDEFLKNVDLASHNIKKYYKVDCNLFATGYASKENGRLSSAIIVSLSKTNQGIMPVYTYVTAIADQGKHIDTDMKERDEYVAKIKKRVEKAKCVIQYSI